MLVTADAGQQISVRVTATVTGLLPGTADSASVTIAKLTSTTSIALANSRIKKGTHGKVAVTVSVAGVAAPTGKLQVYSGTKLLSTLLNELKIFWGRKKLRTPVYAVQEICPPLFTLLLKSSMPGAKSLLRLINRTGCRPLGCQ